MEPRPSSPPSFTLWAGIFEGSLALIAVGLGWMFGQPPLETFAWRWADLGWGLLATAPLWAVLGLGLVVPWGPMRGLLELVERQLVPLFQGVGLIEVAVISILAGLGEEMLFRGLAQGSLASYWGAPYGPWLALVAASLLFAMAHPISPMYFITTGLIGLYLGGIWMASGNLLVPIVAHAVYDFGALVYFIRLRKHPASAVPAETSAPTEEEEAAPAGSSAYEPKE
ncbi:MAG: CPBP family intramembrane glutamic endopeptidase [Planctomycetota bacterium]